MPRILITGLPERLKDTAALRRLLVEEIPAVVERQPGFGIAAEHVYVHALPDLLDDRPARSIVFTVEGLIDRPERTSEMRRSLCEAVADTIEAFMTRESVPCESVLGWCVRMDRQDDGFVRRSHTRGPLEPTPGAPPREAE